MLLVADSLHFAYADKPVLRGVRVGLAGGEVLTLIGPNGSGKSTLIKLLIGHLRGQGSIRWEGRELADWPRRELARRIAYLPQSPTFEPQQRVIDVMGTGRAPFWGAFGIESPRDAQVVQRVASQLELTDLLHRQMDELSGGQRQTVFIGRCLVQEPQAMLLDEPNTFLDLKHQVELGRRIRSLATEQGIAVLMASHDLNLAAAFADRLILLDSGTIAAEGPQDQVLRPDVLSRTYGVPISCVPRAGNLPPVIVPDA